VLAVHLIAEWRVWVAALTAPLRRRLAWRPAGVVHGIYDELCWEYAVLRTA
jgi:hypothetical protein